MFPHLYKILYMVEILTQAEKMSAVQEYITEHFDVHFNKLNSTTEIRSRLGSDAQYRPLTQKVENTIVCDLKATFENISGIKTIVREYLDSEHIKQYDPINDYLEGLPEWDGEDRITGLFRSIPGITDRVVDWLTIWFLSMVAHWLKDVDTLHGNETVPVLIGDQGCGKTTFCQRLLPPTLRCYYMDNINLSNKFDKEMALTSSLLVNLDEFDQIKESKQAELKQALSKTFINGRPIYGRAQEVRKRYASFIATTNNNTPLNDPTGSRRFICVLIPSHKLIDNDNPIDYEQLYAQATSTVKAGKRFWFTNEEALELQQANSQFQRVQNIQTMVRLCFRAPKSSEVGSEMSVKDIVNVLCDRYPTLEKTRSLSIHVGLALKQCGFKNVMKAQGSFYNVVLVE